MHWVTWPDLAAREAGKCSLWHLGVLLPSLSKRASPLHLSGSPGTQSTGSLQAPIPQRQTKHCPEKKSAEPKRHRAKLHLWFHTRGCERKAGQRPPPRMPAGHQASESSLLSSRGWSRLHQSPPTSAVARAKELVWTPSKICTYHPLSASSSALWLRLLPGLLQDRCGAASPLLSDPPWLPQAPTAETRVASPLVRRGTRFGRSHEWQT